MSEPRDQSPLEERIHSEGAPVGTPHAAHELTDVGLAPIVRSAVILTLGVVVVFVITAAFYRSLGGRLDRADPPPHALAAAREIPPEPRLQAAASPLPEGEPEYEGFTSASWQQHAAREAQVLSSYGWIDEQAGIVRIPIERAIELTLEQGLPTAQPSKEPR